jgi:hypothetical protein
MQHRWGHVVRGLFVLGAVLAHTGAVRAQMGSSVARHPADGATGVVLNPELRVEFPGVVGSLDGPFDDAFRVRGNGITLAARRVQLLPKTDGIEFDSAAISLDPNTAYTLETRVSVCAEGASRLCWDDEWRAIGGFSTGTERDRLGPTASLAAEPEPVETTQDGCDWRVRLSAADDHSPSRELRYVRVPALDGAAPQSNPELTLRAPSSPTGAESVTVQVGALDASGNASPPVDVALPACFQFDLAALGCDVGDECDAEEGSGCALSPSPSSGDGVRGALTGLMSLIVLACMRAKRRSTSCQRPESPYRSSPSRTARVRSEARSEPEPASE